MDYTYTVFRIDPANKVVLVSYASPPLIGRTLEINAPLLGSHADPGAYLTQLAEQNAPLVAWRDELFRLNLQNLPVINKTVTVTIPDLTPMPADEASQIAIVLNEKAALETPIEVTTP